MKKEQQPHPYVSSLEMEKNMTMAFSKWKCPVFISDTEGLSREYFCTTIVVVIFMDTLQFKY